MKKILFCLIIFTIIKCKAQTEVDINTFNQGSNTGKYFKDLNNYSQMPTKFW